MVLGHLRIMIPACRSVNTLSGILATPFPGVVHKSSQKCITLGRHSMFGEEVGRMFSSRVKLALLAVASIVGAAFVGGLPWGP